MPTSTSTPSATTQQQSWATQLSSSLTSARRAMRGPQMDPVTSERLQQLGVSESDGKSMIQSMARNGVPGNAKQGKKHKSLVDRVMDMVDTVGIQTSKQAATAFSTAQDRIEDVMANMCLAFIGLASIVVGPFAILFFILRALAIFFNGIGTISWRTFRLSLIQPLSIPSGVIQLAKVALITLWTGILYFALFCIFYFATNPPAAAQALFCTAMPVFCENSTTAKPTAATNPPAVSSPAPTSAAPTADTGSTTKKADSVGKNGE